MFTRRRLIVRRAPEPPHVGHGDSTIEPLPPQREHGCVIEKKPWPCDSTPRPWQTGQTTGDVPGLAPVPWHVSHGVEVGIASDACAPSTASSNDSETSVSRSRPRCGRARPPAPGRRRRRARVRRGAPAPPPPPNRLERMSLNEPPNAFGSKPAPPPAANGPVPWSYALRLSGSDSTSCAAEISLKRSSALASPWLVSGWYWRASLRYAFLISSSEAFLADAEDLVEVGLRGGHGLVASSTPLRRRGRDAGRCSPRRKPCW